MKIIVGIFIVVVVGVLWWFQPQHVIGVNPAALTVAKDGSATVTVQLMYKSWFKRSLKPISGTINATAPTSISVINPNSATTNSAGGRTATFTVTGVTKGTGKIFINGSSRKDTHDTAEISLTVN